ncbi:unnamed protein product [Adineta steineri]|uniref:NAD(+)--protein-arginine ADP-ribosyltransferase n=1 Tax=Adineta steineri TaxID=433720 RepID=A0A813NYI3_9BILA|nr:unnamed protein product [Adineta steineri]CAF1488488.1 unnamed protein product [Adineta steineri]
MTIAQELNNRPKISIQQDSQSFINQISIITSKKPKWDKWNQNAIIVAGGNGQRQKLDQLHCPKGIFIDQKKNIFIADSGNHRIVEWKYNAKQGQIIAGENGRGNRVDQLNGPTDVVVDQQTHSIIIADRWNRRVIQWVNQKQQILIDDIDCFGLATDKHGFLYVSDWKKNEVRRWKMGEYSNEGIIVAGGNGYGNQLNQFNYSAYIFVDEDQSVYVSDWTNHRVMKWRKGVKQGRIVAGGNGQEGNLNQLSYPAGVIVHDLGQIYVVDSGNDRVMRWCEGKEEGKVVVGGNGGGNQLSGPLGISFDDEGSLYVADSAKNRIVKFEINMEEITQMNRFSDIDCLFEKLTHVYGFLSEELVPIEKALEQIESQIANLPAYIKVAKRHCHYPSEHGLTHGESASIYIYTMEWDEQTLYRVLNKTLRNENRHLCKIWFPYLKLFDTALNKLPTVKEVVWRGITADIGKNFTKNQKITWWSINSCLSSVNVIKGFLGNEKNSTTLLIEALNGKKVSGYTKYESEDAIILRVGTEFRVKSDALEHPKGSYVVHLIEID